MGWLQRWLDPPALVERKRHLRASGVRPAGSRTYFGVDVGGCLLPIAAVLALAIAVGVLVGMRLQPAPAGPREAVVRVIDDGATGGPTVLSTQIVPLR